MRGMTRRSGGIHVVTTRRKYKGRVYETTLLRRSFREGGKVRKETVGNLSHLPPEAIAAVRSVLAGELLVPAGEAVTVERSLPHGHVAAVLGMLRDLGLERILGRERSRERDLVVGMICQRTLAPGSKLSHTRRFSQTTLGAELAIDGATEHELVSAMDWLLAGQDRIERALARRHLQPGGFVLYDLSSSYVEGRCCELASLGYSRDGKKGKLQVNYGLICAPDGRPVAVDVFDGATTDSKTLLGCVDSVVRRFGVRDVIFVGDRGMITQTHVDTLTERGLLFVTALKSGQIRKLADCGELQLSLFDEVNLAEITSEHHPGERLVVCRNPNVAAERARKRSELLNATDVELAKVKRMVDSPRGKLRKASAGEIGERVGRVVNKYKVAKHYDLAIANGAFRYERKIEQIEREAALDGIYVIRTNVSAERLATDDIVRTYKQLANVERAFRTLKSVDLEVRPIRHWIATRVRAHIFLCMLAYYVQYELRARLAPLLYTDEHPQPQPDPVAKARRSKSADRKAATHTTDDGLPAHSFRDLLAELGTLTRNTISLPTSHSFTQLTQTTPLQARAFQLLDLKP